MSDRAVIPTDIQTEVLTKSRRRCCVCFGLFGDLSEKQGQIAHIDHDPANPLAQNLVFLCLPHHDRYDGRTSQSKGLTSDEVLTFRSLLWQAIERGDHQQASSVRSADPKVQRILEWKDRLISVHRYLAVEGSMLPGYIPFDKRDFRLTGCNESFVTFVDLGTQKKHSVPLDDVKVNHDEEKYRLLLVLRENVRL
jgi:hypothetical protein